MRADNERRPTKPSVVKTQKVKNHHGSFFSKHPLSYACFSVI